MGRGWTLFEGQGHGIYMRNQKSPALQLIIIQLGTLNSHGQDMNPIEGQGNRSKFKVMANACISTLGKVEVQLYT